VTPSLVTLCTHVFWRKRGFGEHFEARVGSYAFKASLRLLASPKLPTLALNENINTLESMITYHTYACKLVCLNYQ